MADTVRNAESYAMFVKNFKLWLKSTDKSRFDRTTSFTRERPNTATSVPGTIQVREKEEEEATNLLKVLFNFLVNLFKKNVKEPQN